MESVTGRVWLSSFDVVVVVVVDIEFHSALSLVVFVRFGVRRRSRQRIGGRLLAIEVKVYQSTGDVRVLDAGTELAGAVPTTTSTGNFVVCRRYVDVSNFLLTTADVPLKTRKTSKYRQPLLSNTR